VQSRHGGHDRAPPTADREGRRGPRRKKDNPTNL